jgi:hypothetical protein
MLLERGVQVGDVRRVVLVVVDPHRLLVDVRLQCAVVVGERGNFVRHLLISSKNCILPDAQSRGIGRSGDREIGASGGSRYDAFNIRSRARRAFDLIGSGTTI